MKIRLKEGTEAQRHKGAKSKTPIKKNENAFPIRLQTSPTLRGKRRPVKIIPIFLPHKGCPHRCIFCNQKEATGYSSIQKPQDLHLLIQKCLGTLSPLHQKKDKSPIRIEAAFYGGNFTGMPLEEQRDYLLIVYQYIHEGKIDGIRISTRPDYISEANIPLLKESGVKTIELGLQSLNTNILQKVHRYYSEKQVIQTVNLLHQHQFCLGLHLMIGLPGETSEILFQTVEKIIQLRPAFVRIHPTLVLKNTELEKMYFQGDYTPLPLEETISLCKKIALRFLEADIPIARIGLQTIPEMEKSKSIVAGPCHPALGELVSSSIAYDQMVEAIKQAKNQQELSILVPERELSIFIGQHRRNLLFLRKKFPDKKISLHGEKIIPFHQTIL